MVLSVQELYQKLSELQKSAKDNTILDVVLLNNEVTISIQKEIVVDFIKFLRDEPSYRFIQLVDLCGADYPERPERFEVVYHLLSLHHNVRLRIKTSVGENHLVPSLVSVFPVAEWNEREAYDMYGILFSDHPDLRRILTDYGFTGYPLRKDFPTTGYVEVRYDDLQKRVVYEPVKLTQDFRSFDFLSPWEGAKYVLPGDEKAEKA